MTYPAIIGINRIRLNIPPPNGCYWTQERKYQYGYKRQGEEECSSTPSVLTGLSGNIFRCQFNTRLKSIDRLMLRTVITKNSTDIWHITHCPNVSNQQQESEQPFYQITQPGVQEQEVLCQVTNASR